MSGSRCRESGVGTAITIASAPATCAKSVVAEIAAVVDERLQHLARHVRDVALAAVDRVDDVLEQVDQQHLLAGLGERMGVRHADIAGADHCDVVRAHFGVEGYSAAAILPAAWPSP